MVFIALGVSAMAQWRPASEVDTWSDRQPAERSAFREGDDTSRWDFHLSTGTAMVTVGDRGNAYIWAAPKVEYRASDRLSLYGGFSAVGSLLGGYELRGYERSYAPRRRGTQVVSGGVGAEYRVNERLSIWASLEHTGGWHESLWIPDGESMPVGVTTLSGGFSYALSEESLLEFHFHVVHDHYGNDALGLLGHPYYGCGVPSYELYCGPWPW